MVRINEVCFKAVFLPGYVQTPGNDKEKVYSKLMDEWVQISPPFDHVTLVSMRSLNVHQYGNGRCPDVVELYEGGKTIEHRVWGVCGILPPPPKLCDTRELHVHFKSDSWSQRTGFRLLFTHHPVSLSH